MASNNILDSIVAYLSPEAGLRRVQAREALELERKYAAAKSSHWTGFSNQGSSSANNEIGSSWTTVTSRTQQLVRDFPAFASATNCMEAFLVGDGMRFQSLATKPDGTPDRDMSLMLEDSFATWQETGADQSESLTFQEMLSLAVRSQFETGDGMMMEVFDPRRKRFSYRMLDPVNLNGDINYPGQPRSKNPIWFGIEYDEISLKKLGYHFGHPADWGGQNLESMRVDASRVLHGYKHVRPDQLRGMSAFASSILIAHGMQDYLQAELATQQAHSKWTAFVTTPSTGSIGTGKQWSKAEWDETQQKWLEKLEYATVEMLRPGEQVVMNTTQRSSQPVENYTAMILRMVAGAVGVPYEIVSQDYGKLNYSSMKVIRNDFKQALKPKWASLTSTYCRPAFKSWLDKQVLMGVIEIPGYWQRRNQIQRALWIPPGMEPVDPVKDAQANLELMKAGLKAPQAIIMERGQDPDRVLSQVADWRKMLEENGLLDLWQTNNPQIQVDNNANEDESLD